MTTKSPAAAGVYKPREDGLPLVETDMVDPASPDRGKLDTENYLRMLAANTDGWFGWCAFRPTHLCGPGNYNLVRAARPAPAHSPGRILSPAPARRLGSELPSVYISPSYAGSKPDSRACAAGELLLRAAGPGPARVRARDRLAAGGPAARARPGDGNGGRRWPRRGRGGGAARPGF